MNGLGSVIGFGVLTLVILFVALRANYFAFLKEEVKWEFPIRWIHIAIVFAIYFAAVIFLSPLLIAVLRRLLTSSPAIALATWLNFLSSFFILAFIAIYCSTLPRNVAWKIWRRSDRAFFIQDIGFASLSFIIAFPIVIFINETLDLIISRFFHIVELPDQLAVRFLKMTFEYPRYFFLSLVSITVFAPMLEEVLFRGFLQSFIRQHLGVKSAILITSLCFSFFHYSPEQGMSNISIIGSLFPLALFLGYVYEKQGSLFASMILHACFNSISVLNLYFLGGFPKAI
jgi:membrane protease YdiL (CAAX protease family)